MPVAASKVVVDVSVLQTVQNLRLSANQCHNYFRWKSFELINYLTDDDRVVFYTKFVNYLKELIRTRECSIFILYSRHFFPIKCKFNSSLSRALEKNKKKKWELLLENWFKPPRSVTIHAALPVNSYGVN